MWPFRPRTGSTRPTAFGIILEQLLEHTSSLYLNFIDYETAFGSVDGQTQQILQRRCRVQENTIILI